MNKYILIYITLLLPILMGGSCEKRKFSFTGNAVLNNVYTFDNTGAFSASKIIYDSDVRKFLDDLPKDAEVTDVKINALTVKIVPGNGNTAGTVKLSGKIQDLQSTEALFEASDYPIPFAGTAALFVDINEKIEKGLNKAKGKIKNFIMKNEFGNFQLSIEGIPVTGNRLVADVYFKISIQIDYDQCIEVWDYLDAGGEPCNL